MKVKVTYSLIHWFFGVVTAINVVLLVISRVSWPALSGFPELIEGYPVLSLFIEVILLAVGVVVHISIRDRPKESPARMVSYALTLGIALAVALSAFDFLWGKLQGA